jgi:hypothetical protein
MKGVHQSLVGLGFGSLIVLRRVENAGRRLRYLCRCACGTEKAIEARNLQSGRTRSCGCFKMQKITDRQSEVLAFIREHQRENQRPPTRAEIARNFGWSSPNAAEDHIRALVSKGAIRLTPGKARGIEVA